MDEEANSKTPKDDFISMYLKYSSGTECPTFFHRWSAITCLSSFLGRDIHFRQGHFNIYPNLYVMLVGDAGTKKSTAIKMAVRLMELAGYDKFAANKTRQEKFLLDLAEDSLEGDSESLVDNILEQNLFGDSPMSENIAQTIVAADEFNNFIGAGNIEFMSILGELWDWGDKPYKYKLKNSKSILLNRPTISILGGNTSTNMNTCFPSEAIGQGFFSRLILVHAEPTGTKHVWMPLPDEELEAKLIASLENIKLTMQGEITLTPQADKMITTLYNTWKPLEDPRFESYANRRFPILMKLLLVVCANNRTMQITEKEVIYANTMLTLAEHSMPDALGSFGKGRNSDIAHKVIKVLDNASKILSIKDIWKHVYSDLENYDQLASILMGLLMAGKIQHEGSGYLIKKAAMDKTKNESIDWSLLSKEEIYKLGVY